MSRKQAPLSQWKKRKLREKLMREIPALKIEHYAILLKLGYSRVYAGRLAKLSNSEIRDIIHIPKIKNAFERAKEKKLIARRHEYATRHSSIAIVDIPTRVPYKKRTKKEDSTQDPIELLPKNSPVRARLVKRMLSK